MTNILLLNFTESEADVISKAGYAVERGFLGVYEPQKYWPCQVPRPVYEYDILVYASNCKDEVRYEFTKPQNLLSQKGSLEALTTFVGTPSLRISFIGGYTGLPTLSHGGLSFVNLILAEQNVSMFLEHDLSRRTFAIPEMHRLVAGFRTEVEKVSHFITASDPYPFYHFPALISRSGEQVAAYGTSFSDATIPRYVVLPQLKSNAKAVVEIFRTVENVWPVLFPESTKSAWLQGEEFVLPDEQAKDKEIETRISETSAIFERLHAERKQLTDANSFIRNLLVATEDPSTEPPERLSGVVRKALEFVEFTVLDIDEKTRTALRKEDFWVSDGDFFAITEVTGTANTNPKVKEFNDILARIATIYKRKTDLIPPKITNIAGLLVLNYDYGRHPSKRPKAYTGELQHLVETAIEQNIGILSTVELHRIVVAVKSGILTKVAARAILKRPGRIEYFAE